MGSTSRRPFTPSGDANWVLYGIICRNKQGVQMTYIGITNNYEARYKKHVAGTGAKFTRIYRPVVGAVLVRHLTRSQALKLELKYKKMDAKTKRVLVLSNIESDL